MHALAVIFVLAGLLFSASPALAQEKVRVAWAGASPANSPIWVVQEKGFLKSRDWTPR